jgi:hypothetical protein
MSNILSDRISRRAALCHGLGCAAAAIAIAGTATTARAAKMPQTSPAVAYQPTPKGAQQCDGCLLFQAPDACQMVDGKISPTGWCKLWAKKA